MLRRILLACALVASLAFLPLPAQADDTNGASINGFWLNTQYNPAPEIMGYATARAEWHMDHFDDGDAQLILRVSTTKLPANWCVQVTVDAPPEGDPQEGHSDAQILRNCRDNDTIVRDYRVNTRVQCAPNWCPDRHEAVWRVQVAIFHTETSPENKATYFPQCKYMPGFESHPQWCEEWDPWAPNNMANERRTLKGDGDVTNNDGGRYFDANG